MVISILREMYGGARGGGGRGGGDELSHKYMQYAAAPLKYRNGKRIHVRSRKHILLYSCLFAFLSRLPFFFSQIVWVGKIYRHAKIIIYVCSTVCGGGGGGAGGDIDLVNMWGCWGGGEGT